MNRAPVFESYPRLPGPARFIDDVVADLDAGKSVIVVVPDAMVESGLADSILDDIAAEGARTVACRQSDESFPGRVLSTYGADPVSERGFAEWDRVIEWDAWHGSWMTIASWEHRDIEEIVGRWPAQLTSCGLAAEERPKLVVAVRLADLPRTTITHLDRSCMAVHWWWGVLDRLDTETRVAAISDRRMNAVAMAVITELSGWDLHCVDHLVDCWDRTTGGLPAAIHAYHPVVSSPNGDEVPLIQPAVRRKATSPPAELEQLWRDGLVDRWGQSIRLAPHALDEQGIAQRQWLAHNRILIPHVDEERSHYEQLVRKSASQQALEDLHHRDDDIIEIGSLAWLVEVRGVDIGRRERLRLQTFRNLRNVLAHRAPIADELLRQVLEYLQL